MRMLSWLICLRSPNQIYEFTAHFRSNFRRKKFSKHFLLAQKNRREVLGGLYGGRLNIWLQKDATVKTPTWAPIFSEALGNYFPAKLPVRLELFELIFEKQSV